MKTRCGSSAGRPVIAARVAASLEIFEKQAGSASSAGRGAEGHTGTGWAKLDGVQEDQGFRPISVAAPVLHRGVRKREPPEKGGPETSPITAIRHRLVEMGRSSAAQLGSPLHEHKTGTSPEPDKIYDRAGRLPVTFWLFGTVRGCTQQRLSRGYSLGLGLSASDRSKRGIRAHSSPPPHLRLRHQEPARTPPPLLP